MKPRHIFIQGAQARQRCEAAVKRADRFEERALRAFEAGIPAQKPTAVLPIAKDTKKEGTVQNLVEDVVLKWQKRLHRRDIQDRIIAVAGLVLSPATIATGALTIQGSSSTANSLWGLAILSTGFVALLETVNFAINSVNWRNYE